MKREITHAIVPVAGLGTRMLPATKSQPKEMLPVGTKPVVQYVVEELEHSGVTRILFITGKTKSSIENHFDADDELQRMLENGGKDDLLKSLEFTSTAVSFYYTRQRSQRGLGDAVACGEYFTNDEPFIVGLGDSIILGEGSCSVVRQLCEVFNEKQAVAAIAFERVPRQEVSQYGIADPDGEGAVFRLRDIVEKPCVEEAPSDLAVAARYVFSPLIFDAIRQTKPGKGGEIQLTDAIRLLIQEGKPVYGICLPPGQERLDIGNFESYFKGFIEVVFRDPVHGQAVREYARRRLEELEGS